MLNRKKDGQGRKHDPEFMAELAKCLTLGQDGALNCETIYMGVAVNVNWGHYVLPIPYSHLVWFVTHGRWPKEGYNLDHINNNPLDNRIENLQEITKEENHKKRRGRKIYRSYGKGKYGNGFSIQLDKRSGRYFLSRNFSRGQTGGLKTVKVGLGGFSTLSEAEAKLSQLNTSSGA